MVATAFFVQTFLGCHSHSLCHPHENVSANRGADALRNNLTVKASGI